MTKPSDLILERFGSDGWFFGKSKTVPGVLLCAPTAKGVIAQFEAAVDLVESAREQDLLAKSAWKKLPAKAFLAA